MTREEAIAFFKDMNECTYGNLEAVEMAIKALEQQPCEDCISRKDMLAVLRQSHSLMQIWEGFEKLPSVTPKGKTEYEHDHEVVKAYNDGQAYILDKLRAEIEELKKISEKHQSVIDNIEITETHGMKENNVLVHNPQRERYMKFDGKLSAYDEVLEIIDKYREVSE